MISLSKGPNYVMLRLYTLVALRHTFVQSRRAVSSVAYEQEEP
jgi:hypothetical protein